MSAGAVGSALAARPQLRAADAARLDVSLRGGLRRQHHCGALPLRRPGAAGGSRAGWLRDEKSGRAAAACSAAWRHARAVPAGRGGTSLYASVSRRHSGQISGHGLLSRVIHYTYVTE